MTVHDPLLLVNRHLEGELTDEQFDALCDWLRADEKHRALMVRWAAMDCAIRDTFRESDVERFIASREQGLGETWIDFLQLDDPQPENAAILVELPASDTAERPPRPTSQAAAPIAAPAAALLRDAEPTTLLSIGSFHILRAEGARAGRRIPRLAALWAAGLAMTVMFLFWSLSETRHTATEPAGPTVATAPAQQPPIVASIKAQVDAQWDAGEPIALGTALRAQTPFKITHGYVEILMMRGTRVLVEAPCEFVLTDDNALDVQRGRLVAHVPPRAMHFTVRTPHGDIVDHGTEFGVAADAERVQVAVFQGLVEVHEKGKTARSTPTRLNGGYGVTVDRGGRRRYALNAVVPGQTDSFVRNLESLDYSAAVLDARPIAYWSFDGETPADRLRDRAQPMRSGWVFGSVAFTAQRRWGDETNHYLSLRSRGAVVVDSPARMNERGAFTIEAWVRPPRHMIGRMRVMSNRVVGLAADRKRVEEPWRPMFTIFGEADILGDLALPADAWSHVVVTFDPAGRVAIHVNGQQAPLLREFEGEILRAFDPLLEGLTVPDTASPDLWIGRSPIDGPWSSEAWEGGLDELAIYDRVLSSEEIEQHYRRFTVSQRRHGVVP